MLSNAKEKKSYFHGILHMEFVERKTLQCTNIWHILVHDAHTWNKNFSHIPSDFVAFTFCYFFFFLSELKFACCMFNNSNATCNVFICCIFCECFFQQQQKNQKSIIIYRCHLMSWKSIFSKCVRDFGFARQKLCEFLHRNVYVGMETNRKCQRKMVNIFRFGCCLNECVKSDKKIVAR